MKYARLAIEADGRTMEVRFHPRLTVITGVGSASRESLVQELINGLGTNRSGTHLEVETDDGRHLTVFRPTEAQHRVVDMDSGADVSDQFRGPTGLIDLLHPYGLEVAEARRWMRVGPNDLVASNGSRQLIARLARIDQSELWSAARRVQIAQVAVDEIGESGEVEDTQLTKRIDTNYQALDEATMQADRTRQLAVVVGAFGLAAGALTSIQSVTAGMIMIGIAAAAILVAFVFRARMNHYQKQLDTALGEAGSESYLGYQLARIDSYVTDEHQRRHRANAHADVNEAKALWRTVAGDVAVDWALEHRPAIEAASRIQSGRADPESAAGRAVEPTVAEDETPELIDTLLSRLGEVRHLGTGDESFPLLLDEPFGTLDPTIRPAMLEVLVGQAGSPQIILLTNAPDIISWARLEALTGALDIVGPGDGTSLDASGPDDTDPDDDPFAL